MDRTLATEADMAAPIVPDERAKAEELFRPCGSKGVEAEVESATDSREREEKRLKKLT